MSERQRHLEYVARKRHEAADALADEARKGQGAWSSERMEALAKELARWQAASWGYADEALGEAARPLCAPENGEGVDWIAAPPQPVPALLRSMRREDSPPLVPASKVGLLVARGGTGKTQALTQLALSVATGLPWFGEYGVSRPGPVLLILGEEDAEETRRRIQRSARAFGPVLVDSREALEAAGRNVWTFPRYGLPSRLTNDDDQPSPFFDNLAAFLDGAGFDWSCIILDPGSRFMGPEAEKDNAAATRFVEALEALTETRGRPAVIVAHHTSKQAGSADKTDQGAARGSSALVDGARFVLSLHEDPALNAEGREQKGLPVDVRYPRLSLTKANYGPSIMPLRLALSGDGIRPAREEEREMCGDNAGPGAPGGQRKQAEPEKDDPFKGV